MPGEATRVSGAPRLRFQRPQTRSGRVGFALLGRTVAQHPGTGRRNVGGHLVGTDGVEVLPPSQPRKVLTDPVPDTPIRIDSHPICSTHCSTRSSRCGPSPHNARPWPDLLTGAGTVRTTMDNHADELVGITINLAGRSGKFPAVAVGLHNVANGFIDEMWDAHQSEGDIQVSLSLRPTTCPSNLHPTGPRPGRLPDVGSAA